MVLRARRGQAARPGRVPAARARGRPRADHGRPDPVERPDRAGARRGARRRVRPEHVRVRQPLDEEEGHHPAGRRPRAAVRRPDDLAGARRVQGRGLPLRHPGRRDDLQERRPDSADQAGDPGPLRRAARRDRGAVRERRDQPGGAPRGGHLAVGSRHQRGRAGALRSPRRAQPDLHDGQLRGPRLVLADPAAGRHARADGQPEGRDHRAPDQGLLPGGPDRARVLHLDPRCPQGPGRHGAPHRGLGLPDAASGRRLPRT